MRDICHLLQQVPLSAIQFYILLTLFFQAPGEKWPCALTDIQVTLTLTLTQDTADAGHMDTGTQGQGTLDIGQADKRPFMMIHFSVISLIMLTSMTALFWRGLKT